METWILVEQNLEISVTLFILPKQTIATIKRNCDKFPHKALITENQPSLLLFRTESHIQACSLRDLIQDSPGKPYHYKNVPNGELIAKSEIVPNCHYEVIAKSQIVPSRDVMANSRNECLPSSFFGQPPQETGTQFLILSKSVRNGSVDFLFICVWKIVVIAERPGKDNVCKENKNKQSKYKRRKFGLEIRSKTKRKDYSDNQKMKVASQRGQIKARNGTHFGPKIKDISFGVNLFTYNTYQIYPLRFNSLTLVRYDSNYIGYSFTSSVYNGQYFNRSRCVETEVIATAFKMEQGNFYTGRWIAYEQTKHRIVRNTLYSILRIPERNRQGHSKRISCSLCDIVLHSQVFVSYLYISMVRNEVHTEFYREKRNFQVVFGAKLDMRVCTQQSDDRIQVIQGSVSKAKLLLSLPLSMSEKLVRREPSGDVRKSLDNFWYSDKLSNNNFLQATKHCIEPISLKMRENMSHGNEKRLVDHNKIQYYKNDVDYLSLTQSSSQIFILFSSTTPSPFIGPLERI